MTEQLQKQCNRKESSVEITSNTLHAFRFSTSQTLGSFHTVPSTAEDVPLNAFTIPTPIW